jgi:hypothetical protein
MADYPVLNKAPDVAQAVVPHVLDADGVAQPQSVASPGAVAGPGNLRAAQTPVVTSGAAYASGNAVGGLLTFAGMARIAGQGGVLQTALLRDKAGNNVPYDLFLFDAAPTAPTDKTAYAIGADLANSIGVVPFAGLVTAGTPGLFTAAGLGLGYKLGAGTTLYGVLVTRGAPTFSSTADVTVDLVALAD